MGQARTLLGFAAGVTMLALVACLAPEARAQCAAGARVMSSIGGQGQVKLRVDPLGAYDLSGDELGRFWQCSNSDSGNNFLPADPRKRMAPAGAGRCASTDPSQVGGGWWQVSATTLRGVSGFISATGCAASSCPTGDLCTIVEDWGPDAAPGEGDTAYFVGWRSDETPPEFRWWNHAKFCGEDSCRVKMVEFPVPDIVATPVADEFTLRSNRDPAAGALFGCPARLPHPS